MGLFFPYHFLNNTVRIWVEGILCMLKNKLWLNENMGIFPKFSENPQISFRINMPRIQIYHGPQRYQFLANNRIRYCIKELDKV